MANRLFHLYRYQIIPNERIQERLPLHVGDMTVEEVIQNKNAFFIEAFNNLILQSDLNLYEETARKIIIKQIFPSNRADEIEQLFVFKVATRKRMKRETENFESVSEENWPSVFVLIWNDPEQQIIAIEHRPMAFHSTNSLASTLEKRLNEILVIYNLNVQINPMFDKKSFWEFIEGRNLEKVIFKIVTPNMAAISRSISEELKAIAKMSNSATTELTLTAPESGTLNISPSMPQLPELVEYSSKGGGNIRVKYKGIKAITNVKTKQSSLTIDELTIECHPYNLVDRIRDSCREND
ncbi:hypothetical protein [Neisseria elongata]|uniref:hypothetical protein n=1 Tax=Neisseria elongata TaxID=495 RepID=UPI0024B19BE6|nr:hypothetical protein [Neisseria elongata]